MNRGLKCYTKQLTQELGNGCKASVNINKKDANLHVSLPLLDTVGLSQFSTSLIYNQQDRKTKGIFGNGVKLNMYSRIESTDDRITVFNADGSSDEYLKIDGYVNKENNRKAQYVLNKQYNTGDHIEIEDILGNKLAYYPPTDYPQVIETKAGNIYNLDFIAIDKTIKNQHGDVIKFIRGQSNRVDTVVYLHNDKICGTVNLSYKDEYLTKLSYLNENGIKTNETELIYSENELKIIDKFSDFIISYTLVENRVTKITSGFGSTMKTKREVIIAYEENKTAITDWMGKTSFVFFDDDSLPLYSLDNEGYAIETEYDSVTKALTAQCNPIATKQIIGNIFPRSVVDFTKEGNITIKKVNNIDPIFEGILDDTIYNVSGSGKLKYRINTNGLATDNITAVIWGKQLKPMTTESKVSVTLNAGKKDTDTFKKKSVDGNYDLMTLGVENVESFSYIELEISLSGNASIDLGGIQVLKKDFGSFYNYEGGDVSEFGESGNLSNIKQLSETSAHLVMGDATAYTCECDKKGNITKVTMAYDATLNKEYDKNNHLIKTTLSNFDNSQTMITENTYQADGRFLESIVNDLGNTVATYKYDNYGKVLSVMDALNYTMSFNYNDIGLIKDIIMKSSTKELSKASYTYFDNKQIKSVMLKNGSRYDFSYDECNNLKTIRLNNLIVFNYDYDLNTGNLIKQTNGENGDSFLFEYNELNKLSKIYYESTQDKKTLMFSYIYNDKQQLSEIYDNYDKRVLSKFEYDLEGRVVKVSNDQSVIKKGYDNLNNINNVERVIGGNKMYQSFESRFRSKSVNPQALREIFATDENFIGLFSKDGNLIGKTKGIVPINHKNQQIEVQKKRDGLVPCVYVDGSNTLSYAPEENNAFSIASGSIQFWFKPKDIKKKQYVFDILGANTADSISVYLQNGKLYLETYNKSKNKRETPITTKGNVMEDKWNFFAISFMNNVNGNSLTVTEYALALNSNIQHYRTGDMLNSPNVTGPSLYNIGHKFNGSRVKDAFSGHIACVNLANRTSCNPLYIQDFYRLSKEYVISKNNDESGIADCGISTIYTQNNAIFSQFDIYPLHNSVASLSGKKPVEYSIRSTSKLDRDKTFNFNNSIYRYAYVADGAKLVYDFNQSNTGTIVMRAITDNSNYNQYFFEAKDSNGQILGLYRDTNGYVNLDYNGTTFNSKLEFTSNEWHTVGLTLGSANGYVFIDGQTYSFTKPNIKFGKLKVMVGRKNDFYTVYSEFGSYPHCFALNGQIEMLCSSTTYCAISTMNQLMEEIKCSTKLSTYDEFGRQTGCFAFSKNEMSVARVFVYPSEYLKTSRQVLGETFIAKGLMPSLRAYKYDKMGRVTNIMDAVFGSAEYEYNGIGYLTNDNGIKISYDENGNIKQMGNKSFYYDKIIKDRLIKVGDIDIEYNSNNPLNPTRYGDRSFHFKGRNLVKYTIDGMETKYYSVSPKTYEYKYNEQGLRIEKIAPEGTTNYVYDGNKLIAEFAPTYRLDFLYDENDTLYAFINNGKYYYYLIDNFKNIIGIVDENGKCVVKYKQTAFGQVTIDLDTEGIGEINPFRYKSYYYDKESGMYYCQSRYYVPEWGRWLNADERCFNPLSINRVNLFSFSLNSPTIHQELNIKTSEGYDTIKLIDVPINRDEQSVNSDFNFALAGVVAREHTTVGLAPDSFTRRFWGDLSYTITYTAYDSSNHPWFYGFTDSGFENGVEVNSIGGGIKLPGGFGIEGGLNSNGNVFINAQLSNISIGVQYGIDGLSISLGADLGNGVSGAFTLSIGQGTILVVKVVVAVIVACIYAPEAVVEFGKIIVEFGSAILTFLQRLFQWLLPN